MRKSFLRHGPRRAWRVAALAILLMPMLVGCGARSQEDALVDAARALEERVLAPCCWRQPLRDHESELASTLRAEISRRLAEGESSGAIEDDLVRRYGERVRALPATGDPRWIMLVMLASLAAMGLYALSRLVRRPPALPGAECVLEGSRANAVAESERARQLAYEERLEDELRVVD